MKYNEMKLKDLRILKKEYKVQADHYRDLMWAAQEELREIENELKYRKQENCEHTVIDKIERTYFEEGRMRGPVWYDEYFCKKCKKEVTEQLYNQRKQEIFERRVAKNGGDYQI